MTCRANFLKDRFPAAGIRLESESGTKFVQDFLPIGDDLIGQEPFRPLANFVVGIFSELVQARGIQLAGQDFLFFDGVHQPGYSVPSSEQSFQHFAANLRTIAFPGPEENLGDFRMVLIRHATDGGQLNLAGILWSEQALKCSNGVVPWSICQHANRREANVGGKFFILSGGSRRCKDWLDLANNFLQIGRRMIEKPIQRFISPLEPLSQSDNHRHLPRNWTACPYTKKSHSAPQL